MIFGIGTDIVEIDRIKEAVEKWGDRFLHRLYTEKELSYCYHKRDPFPSLAGKFAAKEAAIKAILRVKHQVSETENIAADEKTQIRDMLIALPLPYKTISLREIEILNDDFGMPYIMIHNQLFKPEINAFIHLTISHDRSNAIATVIVELKNSSKFGQ